jgi:hypothetical protein
MDEDTLRVREENIFGKGHTDFTAQKERKQPADYRHPVPGKKNQRGRPRAISDPRVLWVATHVAKIGGYRWQTKQKFLSPLRRLK